jgi:predicted lipoprotein
MKKCGILIGIIVLVAFAGYNSVYFGKLDVKKQKDLVKNFNPKELVDYFWQNQLAGILKDAISLETFDSLLKVNPAFLAKQYGKTVGISSSYCILVKGEGAVVNKKDGIFSVEKEPNAEYTLMEKYIFCNTARDATGYFRVDDFRNTMDFNAVSTELNARIVRDVLGKMSHMPCGTKIRFVGAVEINTESIAQKFDIVPLKLEIRTNE